LILVVIPLDLKPERRIPMALSMSTEELTRRLVAFPTVSSETTVDMANFVSTLLEDGGFSVHQYPYTANGVPKINLVALKGGDEPHLALSGHMDVVPVGEWKPVGDPFTMMLESGKYYGRGVVDMKLFNATAIIAGSYVPQKISNVRLLFFSQAMKKLVAWV